MTLEVLKEQEAIIAESENLLDSARLEKARKSFIHFLEYVIKDEATGEKIKLAELQKTWIYHIAFCKKYSLNALILAPMASGKCVGPNTVFYTQDGEVTAQELKIGDLVLGANNKWNEVVGIEVFSKPCVKVETESGISTIVSLDHPFLVGDEWVEAQDLRPKKDFLTKPVGWDIVQPMEIYSPSMAYLIGVILAKVFNNSYRHFAENIDIIEDFTKKHELEFNATYYKENNEYAKILIESFAELLCPDMNSALASLYLHKTDILHNALAGFFDSAGRFDPKNKTVVLNCHSIDSAEYLIKFLSRAGFSGSACKCIIGKNTSWYVKLTKEDSLRFFSLSTNSVRNSKQRLRATNLGYKNTQDLVTKVTQVANTIVFGIEVSGDHTHVTDGFVTHNTQVISVGLPLYLLGKNPSTRIKLVCLSDDSAKERVSSIRGYIENDPDYAKVFPKIKPGDKTEWTRHKLIVDRTTHAKDASVDAKGIVASAIGGRADVLIVDDIFDQRTAVSQPSTREQYLATYTQVWLSRVEPNGRVVCICTRWHEQDLAGYVMADPSMKNSYGILIQRVADDFSGINCEVHVPDKLVEYYVKENPLVFKISEF